MLSIRLRLSLTNWNVYSSSSESYSDIIDILNLFGTLCHCRTRLYVIAVLDTAIYSNVGEKFIGSSPIMTFIE